MTSTVSRPGDALEGLGHRIVDTAQRLRMLLVRHRATLAWITPVLVIGGLVQAINMAGAPARIDDEGTYTAQAWAVFHLGQLTHYTYWYDHPPLGWLQIAGYTQLTGAFARYDVAVLAAREAMLVAALISTALVWVLGRRLGFTRPAAAIAALVFAISPLAVQFHRTVYLDNVATPWLLGAFILALTKRAQLAAFAGAAACFAIAVLSKETSLLAFPFLVWMMLRSARPETRRYTLALSASILVLLGGSYLLLAAVKGELLPSSTTTSLTNGVLFQLGSRQSSGSPFDPTSLASKTLGMWWNLDPVGIVAGLAAAIVGIGVRRLRPIAVMTVFLALFMLRPGGYLPVPYVIAMLPFGALLITGVTDAAVHRLRSAHPVRVRSLRRVGAVGWGALVLVGVIAVVPLWGTQLRGLVQANLDASMRSAQSWVIGNVSTSSRLIVDDAMWVDLVNAGWNRNNVVWYYKVDTDPAVQALSPNGWKDSDYIITTDSMRTLPGQFPQVDMAIQNSVVVASFGQGTQQVQVRRIDPQGLADAQSKAATATSQRSAAGTQLAANSAVQVTAADRNLLTGGQVDLRAVLALGAQAASGTVQVAGFPAVAGEDAAARRQVLISSIGGQPLVSAGAITPAGKAVADSLAGALDPATATATPDGLLLRWSVAPDSAAVQ